MRHGSCAATRWSYGIDSHCAWHGRRSAERAPDERERATRRRTLYWRHMQEACAVSIRRLYGYGCSEHVFGHALRTLDRDSLVHSSKVGRRMSPKADNDDVPGWREGGLSFKPTFDYSREGTLRSFEQSPLQLGLNLHRYRSDSRRRRVDAGNATGGGAGGADGAAALSLVSGFLCINVVLFFRTPPKLFVTKT